MGFLSAEFVLNVIPNGGSAVFLRSIFVTIFLYLIAIGMHSYSAPFAVFEFSSKQLAREIHSSVPWFGAIFAACYAALYTRFSSQWSYLTDLYNQQMCAGLQKGNNGFNESTYTKWRAAFVEDAYCMHLAKKDGISTIVYLLLKNRSVVAQLRDEPMFANRKLGKLIVWLRARHEPHKKQSRKIGWVITIKSLR